MKQYIFGSYPLRDDREHITWLVLEENGREAKLITEHALIMSPYDGLGEKAWADSDLRKTLTDDFVNKAFTEEQQQALVQMSCEYEQRDGRGHSEMHVTYDNVTVLTADEARRYFPSDRDRIAKAAWQVSSIDQISDAINTSWWLRSPVIREETPSLNIVSLSAAMVFEDGSIKGFLGGTWTGVRPVITINLAAAEHCRYDMVEDEEPEDSDWTVEWTRTANGSVATIRKKEDWENISLTSEENKKKLLGSLTQFAMWRALATIAAEEEIFYPEETRQHIANLIINDDRTCEAIGLDADLNRALNKQHKDNPNNSFRTQLMPLWAAVLADKEREAEFLIMLENVLTTYRDEPDVEKLVSILIDYAGWDDSILPSFNAQARKLRNAEYAPILEETPFLGRKMYLAARQLYSVGQGIQSSLLTLLEPEHAVCAVDLDEHESSLLESMLTNVEQTYSILGNGECEVSTLIEQLEIKDGYLFYSSLMNGQIKCEQAEIDLLYLPENHAEASRLCTQVLEAYQGVEEYDLLCKIFDAFSQTFGFPLSIGEESEEEPYIVAGTLYSWQTSRADIVVPDTVENIKAAAFAGNTRIRSITLPDTVTHIDAGAFAGCTRLEELVLPKHLDEIPDELCRGCASLTKINIPAHVQSIGRRSFFGCRSLEEIILPASVTVIGKEAFDNCISLEVLVLHSEPRFHGKMVNCDQVCIVKAQFPDLTMTAPDYKVVDGKLVSVSPDAEEIDIPEGVTSIAAGVFRMHRCIRRVTLPSTLQEIDYEAFGWCRGLGPLVIPEGVKTLGFTSFVSCTSMEELWLPSTLETIGAPGFKSIKPLSAFSGTGVKILHIDAAIAELVAQPAHIEGMPRLEEVQYTGDEAAVRKAFAAYPHLRICEETTGTMRYRELDRYILRDYQQYSSMVTEDDEETPDETVVEPDFADMHDDMPADAISYDMLEESDRAAAAFINSRLAKPELTSFDGVVFSFLCDDDQIDLVQGFLRSRNAVIVEGAAADYFVISSCYPNHCCAIELIQEKLREPDAPRVVSISQLIALIASIDPAWNTPLNPEVLAAQLTYSREEACIHAIQQFSTDFSIFWPGIDSRVWDVACLQNLDPAYRKKIWYRLGYASDEPGVHVKMTDVLLAMPFEEKYELLLYLFYIHKHSSNVCLAKRWEDIFSFTDSWFSEDEKKIVIERVQRIREETRSEALKSLPAEYRDNLDVNVLKTRVFVAGLGKQKDDPLEQLSASTIYTTLIVMLETDDDTQAIPLTYAHLDCYACEPLEIWEAAFARGIVDVRPYAPSDATYPQYLYNNLTYRFRREMLDSVGSEADRHPIRYQPHASEQQMPACSADETCLYIIHDCTGKRPLSDLEKEIPTLRPFFPEYDDEQLLILLKRIHTAADYPEKREQYLRIASSLSDEYWQTKILPVLSELHYREDVTKRYHYVHNATEYDYDFLDRAMLRRYFQKQLPRRQDELRNELAEKHAEWADWEQASQLLTIEHRQLQDLSWGAITAIMVLYQSYGFDDFTDRMPLAICLHAPDGLTKIDVTSQMAFAWGVPTALIWAKAALNGIYDARSSEIIPHADHRKIAGNLRDIGVYLFDYPEEQWKAQFRRGEQTRMEWEQEYLPTVASILYDAQTSNADDGWSGDANVADDARFEHADDEEPVKREPLLRGTAASFTILDWLGMEGEDLIEVYTHYFTKEPDLTFEGKQFFFSGLEWFYNGEGYSADANPIIQRVQALGGLTSCDRVGNHPLDYLVVSDWSPSGSCLSKTAIRMDDGEDIQMIYLADLEAAVEQKEQQLIRLAEERQRAEEERCRVQREREEAERLAAEQKKHAARQAEEQRKQNLRNQLNTEIAELTRELNSLKGLFAAPKRKKLQTRIDELNEQLRSV